MQNNASTSWVALTALWWPLGVVRRHFSSSCISDIDCACCCTCCLQINGTKYASYRTMIKFNGTTDTAVKDAMFNAVGGVSAGRCTGGYDTKLYKTVAALFKPFKVSQNSEWPALLCIAHAARSHQKNPAAAEPAD